MAHLTLAFLGTFSVTLDKQPITRFRSANVQGLLVYLALNRERAISRNVLTTLFWPNESDSTARANFRQTLYQLRKLLSTGEDEQRPFLHVNRQTVQLNPNSNVTLDVQQFTNGVEKGDLAAAVSHYRGDLLPGFTCDSLEFEDWLRRERERLHGMALDALGRLAEQQLVQDEYMAAKATVQQQLALEPWREAAHRQMMLAHALDGDRQAALAQFAACRDILGQELTAEPDEATQALARRIETDDDLRNELTAQPQHNLPAPITPFFGRQEELTQVRVRVLDVDTRLVTLVGEGGLGKSRLALEVAWKLLAHYRHGVWFVPLVNVGSADQNNPTQMEEEIATAVAKAMGYQLQGKQSAKPQLLAQLRQQQTLLVLDNFEHLLPGANLVIDLLQQAPQVAVLCTSRRPLNYLAEWVYPLPPLPLPQAPPVDPFLGTTAAPPDPTASPAVQLFVDRAQRADGRFALSDDNQQQVAHLCRLLSGLPLALELAAAALRHQTLPQLTTAVQRSIDVLATRRRDVPPRHRSMRAVFTASWQALSAAEQTLFADLSIFRGSFSAADAGHVVGADRQQLHALREKSLIQEEEEEHFYVHELLRQFATERLASAAREAQIAARHSAHFLELLANVANALNGPQPHLAADRIAAVWQNVRQAWQTAVDQQRIEHLLAAGNALSDYCQMRGLYREGLRLFDQAADAAHTNPAAPGEALARLLAQQAAMQVRLSTYPQAEALVAEALPLATDAWTQARLHITHGETLWRQGKLAAAEAVLTNGLALAEDGRLSTLTAVATFHLGVLHDLKGEHETSLAMLEDALTRWQALQNRRWQGFTLNSIGLVAQRLDKMAYAHTALTEALAISRANNDRQGQISTLNNLSIVATEQGDLVEARQFMLQAVALAKSAGDLSNQAVLYENLAWHAKRASRWDESQQYGEESLKLCRRVGDRRREGRVLRLLGDLAAENGRLAFALDYYQMALALSQQVGDRFSEAEAQQSLQKVAERRQQKRA